MNVASDMTELIGRTPLLKLRRFTDSDRALAKCEFMNPMSLKDRPVLKIIEDAEQRGELNIGDTVIEATSGNTGIAVASIAAVRGYHAILVMSEIQSVERRMVLKALGAEVILTPTAEGTRGAREKLKKICAENPAFFYIGQHVNPSNPQAHFETTGPELWADTKGKIDVLVAALGTGGTISGAGRFLKSKKPSIELIAVEPEESPVISMGEFHPHRMMGTAPGFVPETLDRDLIDTILLVKVEDAFAACRRLAQTEGILVGISSGAVARAMVDLLEEGRYGEKMIVGVFADPGERYLSVEGLFDRA